MSLLDDALSETLTIWRRNGASSSGDPTFAAPAAILGRWIEKAELILDRDGEQRRSRATVFLADAASADDWLLRGSSTAGQPPSAAVRIETMSDVTDLDPAVGWRVRKALAV